MSPEALLSILVPPLLGAIVTLVASRLGMTGRLRRLELLERQLAILQRLRNEGGRPDHGSAVSARLEELQDEILEATDATEAGRRPALPPWAERSLLRRVVLLPAPAGIAAWVWTLLYYYLLAVVLLAPVQIASEIHQAAPTARMAVALNTGGGCLLILGVLYAVWRGVRHTYEQRRRWCGRGRG